MFVKTIENIAKTRWENQVEYIVNKISVMNIKDLKLSKKKQQDLSRSYKCRYFQNENRLCRFEYLFIYFIVF